MKKLFLSLALLSLPYSLFEKNMKNLFLMIFSNIQMITDNLFMNLLVIFQVH